MFQHVIKITAVLTTVTLAGCVGIKAERMQQYLTVVKASSSEKTPVVFMFQGSGGNNQLSAKWTSWFKEQGVSAVWIDSAGVRGLEKLYGRNYSSDLAAALTTVSKNNTLDLTRYAVMGFSRGGTAALKAGSSLSKDQLRPDFIFSLYPADKGVCPNSYDENTSVSVFYGDLDQWGSYQGNRNSCQKMAQKNDNATFYLMENSHHGYDGDWSGTWKCCGGKTFTSKSNTQTLAETKQIILSKIKEKWGEL